MSRMRRLALALLLLLPLGICSSRYQNQKDASQNLLLVEGTEDLAIAEASPVQSLKFKLSPDGTIHAIDESGKHFWSFSSGASSLVVIEPIGEWNENDDHVQEDLHEHLKSFISETPFVSEEGVVIGSSLKTVFVVHPTSGALIYRFDVNGSTSGKDSGALLASMVDGFKPIFFQRTDHSLQCFELSTGSVKWNVRFAEIASLNEDDGDYSRLLSAAVNESNSALVINRGKQSARDGFQGSVFTPISVEPQELFNYIMNNRTLPANAVPLQLPSGALALPIAVDEKTSRSLSYGWITGGLIALLALVAVVLKGFIYYRGKVKKNQEQVQATAKEKEKEKRKKRKSSRARSTAQESVSKQDQDRLDGKIRNLVVTNIAIGFGSHGTRILEGYLDGRHVAVKSVLTAFYDKASKEISALIDLDAHPNVVRYFAMEQNEQFVNIALERCSFNMETFILAHTSAGDKRTEVNEHEKDELRVILEEKLVLWDKDGLPSSLLMKLMRDVVEGLVHLHKLGYVHRDLKPQNVLIRRNGKTLVAKLSDMGISKRLSDGASSVGKLTSTGRGSSGWHAPEQIQNGRETRAVDMFSAGCLLYFCISAGRHPFGDELERDLNIVRGKLDFFPIEHIPEATHLLSSLLQSDPQKRMTSTKLSLHPFFWLSQKRLSFLIAASDRVEREDREANSAVLTALEAVAPSALGGPWNERLDGPLIDNLGRYRQYNYQAVRDLLRVIRNKANHYRELPPDVQELLGAIPQGYESYFRARFPNLLMEVYKVLLKHCWEEDMFQPYFGEGSEF